MQLPEPGRNAARQTRRCGVPRTVRSSRVRAFLVIGCVAVSGPASAERWTLLPSIGTRATWTDNAAFQAGPGQSDTILELNPSLTFLGEGRRFRISGTVAADALDYVNGTLERRVLPQADVTANLEAIERFFFVEAGVLTRQTALDVFGPQPQSPANFNTVTTTQYRLAPSFEGRLGGDVKYRLRSGNSWTVSNDTQTEMAGTYQGDHTLRIERQPARFGWALELSRSQTRFESATPDHVTTDSGRLTLLLALSPEYNVGLRGGYERTNLVTDNPHDAIYGFESNWRPSERTSFAGSVEHRFFGTGWNVRFDHRMPRLAWNVVFARDVASGPQAFLTLPPTNNVAALLDAAFTTRFPDPAERSRVVADLIARQGLPSSLVSELSLFAQHVSLITTRTATVAYVGVRNSIALNAFSNRTEDVKNSIFLATGIAQDVDQTGASLTLSSQIATLTSINFTGAYTRVRGIGANEGNNARQSSLGVQLTRQLAPKTTAIVGARALRYVQEGVGFDQTASEQTVRENAGFVGLNHRF